MLRSIVIVSLIAAVTAAWTGETQYKAPPAAPAYGFCTVARAQRELPDESIQKGVIYFSGPFVMKGQNLKPIDDAFLAFLLKKYGYKPAPNEPMPVICTQAHNMDEAKSIEQQRIATAKKGTVDVIETGWVPATP